MRKKSRLNQNDKFDQIFRKKIQFIKKKRL